MVTVCINYRECICLLPNVSDIQNKYTFGVFAGDGMNCYSDNTNLNLLCLRNDEILKVFKAITISTVAL